MSRRRRSAKLAPTPKRARWEPLERCPVLDPQAYIDHGLTAPDAVYGNKTYSVFVREIGRGALHISFHRRDRAAIHDWRHMQAIKNEVAGPERLAVEIFPPESSLVDSSNEYHLWVVPEGAAIPFMWEGEPYVLAPDELEREMGGPTKARQRAWEEGIPTGKGRAA